MTALDSPAADRFIVHSKTLLRGLNRVLDDESLGVDYKNFIFGGRRHRLGHWVERPHVGAIRVHEACKALFCPNCTRCGRHHTECQCGVDSSPCWLHIGQAPVREEAGGEGERAVRVCSTHDDMPWRKALMYSTVAMFPGNRFAKTSVCGAEFMSWILGYRPWDDTLTTPEGCNRIFLIVCQTLATSSKLNIEPLIDKYLGAYIERKHKNSSGGTDFYEIRSIYGTNKLKIVSQDQHHRTVAEVSPLEGSKFYAAWYDEPVTGDIRGAVIRGLQDGKDGGWGRELFSGTPLEGSPQAAAYSFNELYQKAYNRGGRERSLFAMSGSIWDNPDLTPEYVRQTIEGWPAHEREMRTHGIYKTLRGRILADFDPAIHVWNDAERDFLVDINDPTQPSSMPLGLIVDPHDIRPWVFKVIGVQECGTWRVCREWPEADFQQMKHYRAAGVDGSFEGYARVIQGILDSIPGGRARFLWWQMDPAFGDSEKAGSSGTVLNRMRQQGFYFKTDIPREIEPGHAFLRDLMRGSMEDGVPVDEMHRPHFQVAQRCRNTIWALLNYVNDEGSVAGKFREKPAEAGKDDVDCLRYFAMNKPRFRDWRDTGGDLALQQRRLAAAMASSRR